MPCRSSGPRKSVHYGNKSKRPTPNPTPRRKSHRIQTKKNKDQWGGEFRFLRAHLLSIHDEEDRAEGQRIVRAMMDADHDDDCDDDGDGDDESFNISYTGGRGAKSIIPHAEGHMADYHFSEPELVCIEEIFGNSASFLVSYGLKFYDDDDCKEGKRIAQAMMLEE